MQRSISYWLSIPTGSFRVPAYHEFCRKAGGGSVPLTAFQSRVRTSGRWDMTPFDPVSALVGGALIGLAAVLLMLLNGGSAGVSGIFGAVLAPETEDRGWRFAFLVGLIAAPLLLATAGDPMPAPLMPASWAVVIAAGLLVGFGTRLSGGCTS